MSLRGQQAPEFVIVVGVLITLLLVMVVISSEMNKSSGMVQKRTDAARVAHSLAYAMNSVSQAGDGTEYAYYNTGEEEVNITVIGRSVYVNYTGGVMWDSLVTNNTVFVGAPINSYVNISKQNGIVYVRPG